jgi:RND family efflux transporter MFP subunit
MHGRAFLFVILTSGCLGACEEAKAPVPQIRHVRSITVEHRVVSEPVVLLGQIRAQDEISLAFRIDGKLTERLVGVGDRMATGQVVARLDPQNEQNALQGAEADIVAAQAALSQAEKSEARQAELLKRGITSRVLYDQAVQQLQTAQAQLDSAQARQRTAYSRVKYTELHAEVSGTVTAKGAEAGEVVRAGQMIVRVAREDRKDAVFDVPAQLMMMRRFPRDPVVHIVLADNPAIKTTGRVREVAPQADPTTRLFPVKVSLHNPPGEMLLGATVTGGISLDSPPIMTIPITALIEWNGKPSVWVVDLGSNTVELRPIEVARFDSSIIIVSRGLRDGEVVVTAGVNSLHPGQKVKLLAGSS